MNTLRRRSRLVRALLATGVVAGLAGCGSGPGSSPATTSTMAATTTPPKPFALLGCVASQGVRFCGGVPSSQPSPTAGPDLRIPSFDGTPLDADVTIPATGNGPFPLLVILHGLGQNKSFAEGTAPGQSLTEAANGYAVLTYTARGFGRSCGQAPWITTACDKAGWIHLADQRYEIRDTQWLAGVLADEGLVRPGIAVTGVSYGGGQAIELALLDNRIRNTDGTIVAWTSPVRHLPMSVAATYAEWGWNDLVSSLFPNGAALTSRVASPATDAQPVGIDKKAWVDLLYGLTKSNNLSAPGQDPQADLTTWDQEINQGEPYNPTEVAQIDTAIEQYKSPIGIPLPAGGPGAIMLQNGFTDPLFPASEALQVQDRLMAAHDPNPVDILLDGVGHPWAVTNPVAAGPAGLQFLDDVMLHGTRPPSGLQATVVTCPGSAAPGPTYTGPTLATLSSHSLTLSAPSTAVGSPPSVVNSTGGDLSLASALDPAHGKPFCQTLRPESLTGVVTVSSPVGPTPVTLVGPAEISATLSLAGSDPELIGLLWDVAPDGSSQIVEVSPFRPPAATAPTAVAFQLLPNAYQFPAGDTIELQLVGSLAPQFRASSGTFTETVDGLSVSLPVR